VTIEQKTTYVEDGQGRLINQFRDLPNWNAWLASYLQQVQETEDALFELLLNRSIDTSVGEQLDGIGEILKLERGGLSDDDYRTRLKAQIKILKATGTPDEINDVLFAILPTANTFYIQEFPPASFNVIASDEFTLDPVTVAGIIRDMKPAGVKAFLEYTLDDDDNTFTFASGDTAEASTVQGFSNDSGTSGGVYSDAVEAF
jgi:hypothetical protein